MAIKPRGGIHRLGSSEKANVLHESAICRLKKLGRDFFKIVKARPANYDKQMRLGNAARNHCSSQGLSDFSLSLVLGFSLLPSCSRELNSVFVVIQPSFSRSTVSFSADARISLSAHPFSPSCSLPLPPSRFAAATRKRRLRHCGGEKVEEEKEEEAHRDSYLLLSLFLLFCLPAFSNGTFFFRCSASSAANTALARVPCNQAPRFSSALRGRAVPQRRDANPRKSTQIDANRRKPTQTDATLYATPRRAAPRRAAAGLFLFPYSLPLGLQPPASTRLSALSPPLAALLPFFSASSFIFLRLSPASCWSCLWSVLSKAGWRRRERCRASAFARYSFFLSCLLLFLLSSFLAFFFRRFIYSPDNAVCARGRLNTKIIEAGVSRTLVRARSRSFARSRFDRKNANMDKQPRDNRCHGERTAAIASERTVRGSGPPSALSAELRQPNLGNRTNRRATSCPINRNRYIDKNRQGRRIDGKIARDKRQRETKVDHRSCVARYRPIHFLRSL